MKRSLVGSIALSRLKHDKISVKYGNREIKGVFLPFRHNHFEVMDSGAIYMPVRVLLHEEENKFGQHGMITQSVDSKKWKDADETQREKFRNLPIIGNLKDFELGGDKVNSMDMNQTEPVQGSDDMPF